MAACTSMPLALSRSSGRPSGFSPAVADSPAAGCGGGADVPEEALAGIAGTSMARHTRTDRLWAAERFTVPPRKAHTPMRSAAGPPRPDSGLRHIATIGSVGWALKGQLLFTWVRGRAGVRWGGCWASGAYSSLPPVSGPCQQLNAASGPTKPRSTSHPRGIGERPGTAERSTCRLKYGHKPTSAAADTSLGGASRADRRWQTCSGPQSL